MSKDTGGAAFPVIDGIEKDFRGRLAPEYTAGMTLRDYFAAKAPAAPEGWVSTQLSVDKSRNPHNDDYRPRRRSELEIRAAYAYQWADALLAERAK
jgi:hypothetical protein